MVLVDVVHDVYHCPCCEGYIVLRTQYPYDGCGSSSSLEHYLNLPEWLKKEVGVDKIAHIEKR